MLREAIISRGIQPLRSIVLARVFRELSARQLSSVTNAHVTVDKDPTLADEPFRLSISGLAACQKITLHASTRLPNNAVFESASHYIADESGNVHVDRDKSYSGSFTGVEPMGPLSFMVPSATNKKKYERFLIKDPTQPFAINFHVLDSFVDSLEDTSAKKVHQTPPNLTITRTYMAPGVEEIPILDGRVRGTLYIPAGKGPFPGVISVSGGYPGAMKHKAAILASHGFVALALKYFGEDDLPMEFFNVDLDYAEEAAVLLRDHPKVDSRNGVGVIANCYGALLGFGLCTLAPTGLIGCVASTNGWFFPYGNIFYNGEKVKVHRKVTMNIGKTLDGFTEWKFSYLFDRNDLQSLEEAALPIYKYHDIAFMFVAGERDGYIPGDQIAPFAETLLRTHKHPNYKISYYKGAGHLIEHSFYPLASIAWTLKEPHYNGGEQPGHSIAQNDSWPKILEFTRKNLTRPSIASARL